MTTHQKQSMQQAELHSKLWDMANSLRGTMEASEFKNYILGLIFYRYLSENILSYVEGNLLKADNITYADAWDKKDYKDALIEELLNNSEIGYVIEPKYLYSSLINDIKVNKFDISILQKAINELNESVLGTRSQEDFENLFDDMDLNSSKLGKGEKDKSKLISTIMLKVNEIDFRHDDSEIDVLGDAYEYLISKFAATAGKKAGEFYTPQQVSKILAKIVTMDKDKIKNVYDPTCGSGSLLLRVAKEANVGSFYGQELTSTTYNLARMNMILHGVPFNRFDIHNGNTITNPYPKHMEKRFDAIVANPPYSAKWTSDNKFLDDERFSAYGKLAPKSAADYAFIQHMLYLLDDKGTMAVVLPHGVLFRGAAEGVIRKHIIEKNYLDTVIGLPANIFYGTSIPTTILVFKKCKTNTDILFIDASKEFEKQKNQNNLSEDNVAKILETYKDRKGVEKYSHVASLDEIKENDYNLNIPRYVDIFEEEEPIDINEVQKDIKEIEKKLEKINRDLNKNFEALGLKLNEENRLSEIIVGNLRFKDENDNDFPDWETLSFTDCFTDVGGSPLEKYCSIDGTYKFISIGNYTKNGKYYDNGVRIILNDITKTKVLDKNDLVMVLNDKTASGDIIGSTILIKEDDKYIYNQRSQRIICKQNINPDFAWILLNTKAIRREIFKKSQGGTQIYINFSEIKKIKFRVPIKKEQEKISRFIMLFNNKIALEEKKNNKMKQIEQFVIKNLFL